jgi:FkbM family methyltransferase
MINKILHKLFGVRVISSQCGEDLIIESFFPAKKDGLYVDVGAHHPIKFSNTLLFYNKGWRGINIEPDPSKKWLFKIFRFRDINLNMGVGPEKTELDFYSFKTSTLSTFDKKAAEEYQKMGHKVSKVFKIEVLPLKDVFAQHVGDGEVDILSVDVEGYDMEVLKSNDWKKYRPRFIILETLEYRALGEGKKLNGIYDEYMKEIGYRKVADTYINTIYEKNN